MGLTVGLAVRSSGRSGHEGAMNVLCVLIDSLNRHYLAPYGSTEIRTPNLSSFANRALVFDQHFIGCGQG